MDTQTKVKQSSFPRILADLKHSNQFLKVFSLSSVVLSILLVCLSLMLALRKPVVLTLTPAAEGLKKTDMPKPEDEIRAAIQAYIDRRYKWEPANVNARLQEAEAFVLPNALRAYRAAVNDVVKFSVEKSVAQRVYAENVRIDLDRRTASISGDRVTSIQGLKAAGDLRLELSFESGPRTRFNPWGVYISKEKE